MQNVKLISNAITSSSYILSSAGADTDYPITRLCDGDINDLWKKTMPNAPFYFTITLPVARGVDFLAVCTTNLATEVVTLKTGVDTIASGTIPSTGSVALASSVKYTASSFSISFTASTNPQIAELFLGYRGFDKHPNYPGPIPSYIPTAEVSYTRSGHRWVVKKGEVKWSADYNFTLDDDDMTFLTQFLADTDYGLKPFYMYDHNGTIRYVESALPIKFPYEIPGDSSRGISSYYKFDLSVTEVF